MRSAKKILIGVLALVMCAAFLACGKQAAEQNATTEVVITGDGIEGSWKSNVAEAQIGKIYLCLEIDGETFRETCYNAKNDKVIEVSEGPYVMEGTKVMVNYENMQGLTTIYTYENGVLSGGQYVYERIG